MCSLVFLWNWNWCGVLVLKQTRRIFTDFKIDMVCLYRSRCNDIVIKNPVWDWNGLLVLKQTQCLDGFFTCLVIWCGCNEPHKHTWWFLNWLIWCGGCVPHIVNMMNSHARWGNRTFRLYSCPRRSRIIHRFSVYLLVLVINVLYLFVKYNPVFFGVACECCIPLSLTYLHDFP